MGFLGKRRRTAFFFLSNGILILFFEVNDFQKLQQFQEKFYDQEILFYSSFATTLFLSLSLEQILLYSKSMYTS